MHTSNTIHEALIETTSNDESLRTCKTTIAALASGAEHLHKRSSRVTPGLTLHPTGCCVLKHDYLNTFKRIPESLKLSKISIGKCTRLLWENVIKVALENQIKIWITRRITIIKLRTKLNFGFKQSRTSSLRSLLRRLDETSDSRKFRCKIDIDWFVRQYKCPEVKFQGVRWSFI